MLASKFRSIGSCCPNSGERDRGVLHRDFVWSHTIGEAIEHDAGGNASAGDARLTVTHKRVDGDEAQCISGHRYILPDVGCSRTPRGKRVTSAAQCLTQKPTAQPGLNNTLPYTGRTGRMDDTKHMFAIM